MDENSTRQIMDKLLEHDQKFVELQNDFNSRFETLENSFNARFKTLENGFNTKFETIQNDINQKFGYLNNQMISMYENLHHAIAKMEYQVTDQISALFDAYSLTQNQNRVITQRLDNLEINSDKHSARISVLENIAENHSKKLSNL